MAVEELINAIHVFDLLVVGALIGFFILGYAQGVVRRLIGIISVTFSFVMAANVREPFGEFLARNWTQFPADYSSMIGFGFVFAVMVVGLALITQVRYKRVTLWTRTPVIEELVGGFLGVVQGLLILMALIVIIDPYFRDAGAPAFGELPVIRGLHDAMKGSVTLGLFREIFIPGFFSLLGAFIPDAIKDAFPGSGS